MHALRKWPGRYAGPLVAAATWSLLRLAGCDSNGTTTDDMATSPDMAVPQPSGPPTAARSVATVDRPLAAVLSPDGKTVYLTAHDANGLAQLYSVPAAGGTPAKITTSVPLIHPLSLAIGADGNTLYIVDSAGGAQDAGTVYSGNVSGSITADAFTGVRGPAGVAVATDGSVYVSGFDAADGRPGLFKGGAGGGALTPVVRGAPFSSPSAVTVGGDGSVYVVDATARGAQQGAVIKVTGSTGALFTPQPLGVGFSAGISPQGVGSSELLVTANTGLGSGAVYRVDAGGNATALALGASFFDPATIHRAANVSVWVAVDSVNGTQANPAQQLGQVYVLTP